MSKMMLDERGRQEVAGIRVYVKRPPRNPVGLTFVLTAANVPFSNYHSITDALLELDHVVVGYYINVASPPWKNHRIKAQDVYDMFEELRKEFTMITKYNIVGHSVGGKIALMVAALHNSDKSLQVVVALDPVDQNPVEFTNKNTKNNLSLTDTDVDIVMTFTDNGFFISKDHNARAINQFYRNCEIVLHRNAAHMAYCDADGGLSWKNCILCGNRDRDATIKDQALDLIKIRFEACIAKKAGRMADSFVKNIGDSINSSISDFNKDVAKATKMSDKRGIMQKLFNL